MAKNYERQVVAVDLDRTLTKEVCWNEESMKNASPDQKAIEKVNKLYETGFIIIYTGRRRDRANVTLEWLEKNRVRYHAIRFDKMPFDMYIDNDAYQIKDL